MTRRGSHLTVTPLIWNIYRGLYMSEKDASIVFHSLLVGSIFIALQLILTNTQGVYKLS